MNNAINNENKKLNVPNLRFPEFEGEWEKCKLGKLSTKITKKNKDNLIQNVLCNSATLGLIPQNDYFDREIANSNNTDGYYVVEYGDFVYNPRKSVSAPYGPVNIYTRNEKGIISPLYLCFSVHSILPSFLYYRFKSSAWFSYVYSHGDTGTRFDRVSIKDDVFFDMPIYMPSQKEQKKISSLMSLLDERIATQNKIIEDLKKLKSAISENLFKAVNGDVVILSEICEIIKGKQVNGEFLSEKGKYYVMNGGTEPSGYYSDYNVEANTISISEGGNSCGYVQFNTSPFWSGGHCYTIQKIAENVDYLYLYHYLKSKEDAIMKLRIGSGLPNIQKKDLAMFKIKIPTVEQQKAISTFLSSLERKAEIEERIQNAMQKEKQYLLRQMFI